MEQTKLNFINLSEDLSLKSIVIYQPNEADMSHDEVPIAWKVIKNIGKNDRHLFEFDTTLQVGMDASFGNYVEPIEAKSGKILEAIESHFGAKMQLSTKSTHDPNEFGVRNSLSNDSISINCIRDGRLLATRERIYPGDAVMFRFSDVIRIALVSEEIHEGQELHETLIREVEIQFDLAGVSSADIVMTGGGTGGDAQPFEFSMDNVERKVFKRKVNEVPSWWGENEPNTSTEKSAGTPSWWKETEDESNDSQENQSNPGTMPPPSWWKE